MSRLQRLTGRLQTDQGTFWLWAIGLLALVLVFLERVLIPPEGQVLGGLDVHGLFYPWLSSARAAIWSGRLPLWDAAQFAGYPFLANPQVGLFYPPTWLAILLPTRIGISLYVALHLWLAGVGMLRFVRAMGGSWLGAGLAGLTFAFSGFMTARIYAGHTGLIATDAWLPWLLLATLRSVERGSLAAALVAGLPLGLAILAGHTTSLIYIGFVWAAFILYLLAAYPEKLRTFRQVAIVVLVGLALSAVQTIPFLEFSGASARASAPSYEFASSYSLPPVHLITLLLPEFFGEPTRAGYWSVPNFEELTYYAGILPILGLVAALRRPAHRVWFYVALIVFGLLVALGSYGFVHRLLYDLLPPFRLARAPGRAAFLFTFAASALLGEAVTRLQSGADDPGLRRSMSWAVIVASVVAVAGLAATGAAFAAVHPSDTSGLLWHQIGAWALAGIVTVVGGVLLRQLAADHSPQRLRWVGAALGVVILSDLWLFGSKLTRTEPAAPAAIWPEAKQLIGETDQRVLPWGISIFEQNGAGEVGLKSVFGYNALEIAASQSFAASIPDPRSTAYDVLGVEYVIAGGPLDDYTQGDRPLALVGNTSSAWVYRRGRVLPVARLVYDVEVVESPQDAVARVHAPDFDPAAAAILCADPGCPIGPAPESAGTAHIVEAEDGRWVVETESEAPALLVLSETAYPGWRVTIDDGPAQPLSAYTVVKAVCVPSGTHRVEWRYQPTALVLGGAITLIMLAGIAAAILVQYKERTS